MFFFCFTDCFVSGLFRNFSSEKARSVSVLYWQQTVHCNSKEWRTEICEVLIHFFDRDTKHTQPQKLQKSFTQTWFYFEMCASGVIPITFVFSRRWLHHWQVGRKSILCKEGGRERLILRVCVCVLKLKTRNWKGLSSQIQWSTFQVMGLLDLNSIMFCFSMRSLCFITLCSAFTTGHFYKGWIVWSLCILFKMSSLQTTIMCFHWQRSY